MHKLLTQCAPAPHPRSWAGQPHCLECRLLSVTAAPTTRPRPRPGHQALCAACCPAGGALGRRAARLVPQWSAVRETEGGVAASHKRVGTAYRAQTSRQSAPDEARAAHASPSGEWADVRTCLRRGLASPSPRAPKAVIRVLNVPVTMCILCCDWAKLTEQRAHIVAFKRHVASFQAAARVFALRQARSHPRRSYGNFLSALACSGM